MKQKLIKDFHIGDSIEGFFVLRKKELRNKKNKTEQYLALEFGDCSGRIQGSLWKDSHKNWEILEIGKIVKVTGDVISYKEKPHLTIQKIHPAAPEDKVKIEDFLPVSEHDSDALFEKIKNSLLHMKNPHLLNLANYFLEDENFVRHFKRAPAGKLWHHACIGGLAEHTWSVMRLCEIVGEHYEKNIDIDLLKTAAFLHDIGKIDEFKVSGFIDYSTQGRLIGHVNIGFQRVSNAILKLEKFPRKLSQQILHCILSHHGEREKGAPVVPMTLEALILSYIDEMDSMVAAFHRIMAREIEPGKLWSRYVNLIDRFIYMGGIKEKVDNIR